MVRHQENPRQGNGDFHHQYLQHGEQQEYDNEKLHLIDSDDLDYKFYYPVKPHAASVTTTEPSPHNTSVEPSTEVINIQIDSGRIAAIIEGFASIVLTIVLTGLSAWTRYRDIQGTIHVTWDEAHFGKFGSYYLRGEYYFDVHPPLAKMLVGYSGYLGGYDGSFDFPSGEIYPDINYSFMRLFNATFGVIMIPMAFWTARELGLSRAGATLAATMVLLDNAYLAISRYILLDSMLLSSTIFVVMAMVKFRNLRSEAFSAKWWLWLALTGLGIGFVASVKWVGLFVTALVGLHTIEDLWDLFGDLNLSKTKYTRHWIARIIFLIALPATIYVGCFVLHFRILVNTGSGDSQMSSLFQANLNGSSLKTSPLEVAFGSKLTFKNTGHGGGILHSHKQTYPGGSRQQQVTLYHHRDENNFFVIRKPHGYVAKKQGGEEGKEEPLEMVKNGAIFRLVHPSTGRNLHSHKIRAPITTDQWEVSGYGNPDEGDENDEWMLEIVSQGPSSQMDGTLRSLTTRFLLRHRVTGCLLTAEAKKTLPSWGFNQVEVYCDQRNQTSNAHSIWNIEQHLNDKLPPGDPSQYKSNFWEDFWHLNVAMMTANNGLIPDPDKEDPLASKPSQWPFLAIGIRMCGWSDKQRKVWLIGNPAVWWSGTLSLGIFLVTLTYYSIVSSRAKCSQAALNEVSREHQTQEEEGEEGGRSNLDEDRPSHAPMPVSSPPLPPHAMTESEWADFVFTGKVLVGGWFLHYLPFCVMGRVTYLHHYFPALYFTILLCSFLLDHFVKRSNTKWFTRWAVWSVAFLTVISTFLWFAPVTYGVVGSMNEVMANRQWRSSWNIIDDHTPAPWI